MESEAISGGYTSHNRVQLVRGGEQYFSEAQRLINHAVHSVHLQTYIFEDDETGVALANALIRASFRNVKVYVLLDGYASSDLGDDLIIRMQEAGIHFRWFQPFLKGENYYVGRRMHHKLIVVDGLYSLVGGINVSNRYNDLPGQPAWLDWAVRIEGEASAQLFNRCVAMWTRSTWKKVGMPILFNWRTILPEREEVMTRIRINDWVRNKNQISRSYAEMFHRATREITIMSSYFLPGRVIMNSLNKAAQRGVRIKIILTSISDVGLSKSAENYLYPWLFARKIEVYEYQKTVLHGKIAVYDRQWATVGSYNVNNISAYASIELNVDVLNTEFAASVDDTLNQIIRDDCVRITKSKFSERSSLFSRIRQRLSYETIRFILYLFTFYFKQETTREN
ncbi:MAG: phospholipase D-like domain-containing protein [Cytophagales bacterium]|nr:phospholipase D-like domain-containing protein [Cytophagales bacterium]